jgi:hypothetical protein
VTPGRHPKTFTSPHNGQTADGPIRPGITGLSTLAIGSILAIISILFAARFDLYLLVER